MYLKKLELVGFKSFYNKTVLHFEPGITAIVGPNGCGKSNIFDAIRWVLGEQSTKSLRTSDMQDVIFNGTDKREPLSMAEVSITFDNRDRFFNIDTDELVITRRVFRSGEGEYLINKTEVRLKDILDYLLGTGIGAESYSLVQQGKIDLILSARAEERRLVFDEASGITKYKLQKKETQRKLEETENNLLRLNDIISEVNRQISSLERQANRARRYKEILEELKNKEVAVAKHNISELLSEKQRIEKELSQTEARLNDLLSLVRKQEEAISEEEKKLEEFRHKREEIESKIIELKNLAVRYQQNIDFNLKQIEDLDKQKENLSLQEGWTQEKLKQDKEKLDSFRNEYQNLTLQLEKNQELIKQKDQEYKKLLNSLEDSLSKVAIFKKEILEIAMQLSKVKNEITELATHKTTLFSRKKRLEIEKIKIEQDKKIITQNLDSLVNEFNLLENQIKEKRGKLEEFNSHLSSEEDRLKSLDERAKELEKNYFSLLSQKEFIEKANLAYKEIKDVFNALVYLDRLPQEQINTFFINVKETEEIKEENLASLGMKFMLKGEAKPLNLDIKKIEEKINHIQEEQRNITIEKEKVLRQIETLKNSISEIQDSLRKLEIESANKKVNIDSVQTQVNKIKEEEEIILEELREVDEDYSTQEKLCKEKENKVIELQETEAQKQMCLKKEEENISTYTQEKEKLIVEISSIQTEIESLKKRLNSDKETLQILESTYEQDKHMLSNLREQISAIENKKNFLIEENQKLGEEINNTNRNKENLDLILEENKKTQEDILKNIDEKRKILEIQRKDAESLKNNLHTFQMQIKDLEYKILSIKERILQSYKLDIETIEAIDYNYQLSELTSQIEELKNKLDNFGSVNLVAIEEYDELKKRYDFLIQQQNDLISAKESLQEAISKINRTAKKLFLETFEKISIEFRNYFRLLFGGGDTQLILIDENDPLESGIEIICRPPGKKLQNVIMLSGGEKSLAAIALIFAIFKVKPSPFCVLDEIDAALDEANVDRVARMLQEFSEIAQFIVITHNKKTIANADVMYGITMEEQGISKIVSVKFSSPSPKTDLEKEKETVGV